MRETKNYKREVLNALTREWQSTGKIASLGRMNFYLVERALQDLLRMGRVECNTDLPVARKWRVAINNQSKGGN